MKEISFEMDFILVCLETVRFWILSLKLWALLTMTLAYTRIFFVSLDPILKSHFFLFPQIMTVGSVQFLELQKKSEKPVHASEYCITWGTSEILLMVLFSQLVSWSWKKLEGKFIRKNDSWNNLFFWFKIDVIVASFGFVHAAFWTLCEWYCFSSFQKSVDHEETDEENFLFWSSLLLQILCRPWDADDWKLRPL